MHSLGFHHADTAILAILKDALQMATDNYPEVGPGRPPTPLVAERGRLLTAGRERAFIVRGGWAWHDRCWSGQC